MIVNRVTTDMFEFASVCDYMVNPVNLMGVAGAGLALEFRKRVPDYFEKYEAACKSKELRIGTIQIIEDTDEPWGLINLPTKRHWQDQSSPDDIARGLEALRDTLNQDRYRHSVIGMPMLGCGCGRQDYSIVLPMMDDYLSTIEATVFLSMAPDKTDMKPRYLTIAGPMDYGRNDEEKNKIDWVITKTLEQWETNLSDYTGIVSGGYPGVDAYVCGSDYGKAVSDNPSDVPYQDTYVYKKTDKMPLVCKPNSVRNGVGSNLHLGNLLCEIGDDVILFKPKSHNNNRLSAMQTWLQANREQRDRDGLFPKRVSIFGDRGTDPISENVLIPVTDSDIPY